MVRNMNPEERQSFDDLLEQKKPEPGKPKPPPWWKGEEEAAKSAQSFMNFARSNG